MSNPPIPFTPEPLASLRARYATALRTVFNSGMIIAGRQKRPGEMHANIFDTDQLARIAERKGEDAAYAELETLALSTFRFISEDTRPILPIGTSEETGIPHWFISECEEVP
jgi:hypothetical protein